MSMPPAPRTLNVGLRALSQLVGGRTTVGTAQLVMTRRLVAGACLIGCLGALAFAGSARAGTWSASPVPLPPGNLNMGAGNVDELSCPAPGWCSALAYVSRFVFSAPAYTGPSFGSFILTEQAGVWKVQDPPQELSWPDHPWEAETIDCAQPNNCVAFIYQGGPYILSERNGAWSVKAAPSLPSGHPYRIIDVACPTALECTGVGGLTSATGPGTPVLVTGNNGVWTARMAPLPPDLEPDTTDGYTNTPDHAFAYHVVCPDSTHCVAAGGYHSSAGYGSTPLVISGSGDNWTATSLSSSLSGGIYNLECPAVERCVALNSDSLHINAFRQIAGGGWVSEQVALPADYDEAGYQHGDPPLALGMSCPTAGNCWATGSYWGDDDNPHYAFIRLGGGGWSAQTAPMDGFSWPMDFSWTVPGTNSQLAIQCPQMDACVAVTGGILFTNDDGFWEVQALPLPAGAAGTSYRQTYSDDRMSCADAGACLVSQSYGVGAFSSSPAQSAFIYQGGPFADAPNPVQYPDVLSDPNSEDPQTPSGGGTDESGSTLPVTNSSPGLPPGTGLTVTVAPYAGGGFAGNPDPTSFYSNGNCDPGADSSWLNIAGTTLTCIGSGEVWDDPAILSAKKKCVINLTTDFLPFLKAFKLPKYFKKAQEVKLSIGVLATRLKATTYPKKLSGDAKAVENLKTVLDLVKSPDEAILTAISSRRVLDGLITKLGKGGPAALKLAKDVAVVRAAIEDLIKTVTGINDIEECVAAFSAP